jgi:hypothetical protein
VCAVCNLERRFFPLLLNLHQPYIRVNTCTRIMLQRDHPGNPMYSYYPEIYIDVLHVAYECDGPKNSSSRCLQRLASNTHPYPAKEFIFS